MIRSRATSTVLKSVVLICCVFFIAVCVVDVFVAILKTGSSAINQKNTRQSPKFNLNFQHGASHDEVYQCDNVLLRPQASQHNQDRSSNADWQLVEANVSYSYAAFADLRDVDSPVLRVLGIHQVNPLPGKLSNIWCRMWYQAPCLDPILVPANIRVLPIERFPYRYRSVFFDCILPRKRSAGLVPFATSLVSTPCQETTNLHYVRVISPVTAKRKYRQRVNFTVCVPPFHLRLGSAYDLAEHIEVNSLLGADKFIFYNYSLSSILSTLLRSYRNEGKIEVLKWNLPQHISLSKQLYYGDLFYFGQSAAVTDCLYRTMYRSRYTAFMDFDEFIVPRAHGTWHEMLKKVLDNSLINLDQRTPAAFVLSNVFFDKYLPADEVLRTANISSAKIIQHIKTLVFTKRRSKIYPFNDRSKFIVVPELIDIANVHSVTRFHGNCKHVQIQPEQGLLHHYRYWQRWQQDLPESESAMPWIEDRYMHRFTKEIILRVAGRLGSDLDKKAML